jgi:hypothetical protein
MFRSLVCGMQKKCKTIVLKGGMSVLGLRFASLMMSNLMYQLQLGFYSFC